MVRQVIEKVTDSDEKISSTRIRKLLSEGDVEEHGSLLGQTIQNSRYGHRWGEKRQAARISDSEHICPTKRRFYLQTAYMQSCSTFDGQSFKGVCNVGVKPTFHDPDIRKPSVEVHLFDFEGDLYGKEVGRRLDGQDTCRSRNSIRLTN